MTLAVIPFSKRQLWLIKIPQAVALVSMVACLILYQQSYENAAVLGLAGLSIACILWFSIALWQLMAMPAKQALRVFSSGMEAFPELSGILHKNEDSLTPVSALTMLFQYLEDKMALYQEALSIAAEAIVTIDKDGKISSFNQSAERMFGYFPKEVIGLNLSTLLASPHRRQCDKDMQDFFDLGEERIIGKGRELEAVRKDGTHFPIYLSVKHVHSDLQGNVFFGVIVDLSIAKQREHEILEARDRAEAASMAKDSFIANISHELRTPLNAILGFCEMLRFTELKPKQQEYLEYVHSCGQQLLSIVNGLLDLSAMAQGRLKIVRHSFDLHKILLDVATGFDLRAQEKGLEFQVDISPDLPRQMIGDSNKLRQAISNLLNNAVRFTELGYVKIIAECAEDNPAATGTMNIRFVVEDSGMGVPLEKRELIFGRFNQADNSLTRKYGGTGVGLAICRELMDLMDGCIYYEANSPAGSRFIIELPMQLAVTDTQSADIPRLPVKHNRLQVLVVEDDFHNMALIREFLSRTQCNIYTANNGAEAINHLQKEKTDIVLLDINMPVLGGVETISNIRRMHTTDTQGRPIFVAALTADAMKGDEQKYLDIGFDEYVSKPVSFHSIIKLLEKYSGSGVMEQQQRMMH